MSVERGASSAGHGACAVTRRRSRGAAAAASAGGRRRRASCAARPRRPGALRAAPADAPARRVADDRRPRPGRGLGRARGARPVRRCASTATSRCARSSTTPPTSRAWTVPVRGDDVHQVAVGPIHAGVIESGHFRFHVVGERILHLDPRLFYKHRGLERAAEGRRSTTALAYVAARLRGLRRRQRGRLRAGRARQALGLWPDARPARARARCCSSSSGSTTTCNDIAAICAGVGFAAGAMAFAALKERAQRLNAQLDRPPLPVRLGRRRRAAPLALDGAPRAPRATSCARSAADVGRGWRELAFAALGPGPPRRRRRRHARRRAARSAPSGPPRAPPASPTTRAAHSPRLSLRGLRARAPRRGRPATSPRGSRCAPPSSRRPSSCSTSCSTRRSRAGAAEPASAGRRSASAASRARAARRSAPSRSTAAGSLACTCAPARTPTGRSLAHAAAGNLLPDFPLINKSFELCYACVGPLMLRPPPPAPPPPPQHRACRRPRRGSLAVRHVDAGSCNGCEHELGRRREPVLRPAALRPGHRRLAPPRRRPARHRPGHHRMASRCAPPTPRCPSPGCRRAGRLRARLRRARRPPRARRRRSRSSCPSTSASPAARRRPATIAEHLLRGLGSLA